MSCDNNYIGNSNLKIVGSRIESKVELAYEKSILMYRDILKSRMGISRLEIIKVGKEKYEVYSEDIKGTGENKVLSELVEGLEEAEACMTYKIAARIMWGKAYRLSENRYEEKVVQNARSLVARAKDLIDGLYEDNATINMAEMKRREKVAKDNRDKHNTIERYSSILMSPVCEKVSLYRCIDSVEYKLKRRVRYSNVTSVSDNMYYIQLWSLFRNLVSKEPIWIISKMNKAELDANQSTCIMTSSRIKAEKIFRLEEEVAKYRGFGHIVGKLPDIDYRKRFKLQVGDTGVVELKNADNQDDGEWLVSVDVGDEKAEYRFKRYIEAERCYVEWIRDHGNDGIQLIENYEKKIIYSRGNREKKKEEKEPEVKDKEIAKFVKGIYEETVDKNAQLSGRDKSRQDSYGMELVGEESIRKGVDILDQIDKLISSKSKDRDKIRELSMKYFMTVPRVLSYGSMVIDDKQSLDLEYRVLDLYSKYDLISENVAELVGKMSHSIRRLTGKELCYVVDKVESTIARNHHFKLRVTKAYKVDDKCKDTKFNSEMENAVRLFHGTAKSNVYPILCSRLALPRHGGMFGKGIYFADKASKSANYSFGYWGGTKTNIGYLFIVKVALGKVKEYYSAQYDLSKSPSGFDSVKGCKGSSLLNNEYIVYNENQATIEYVVEVEMINK